MHHLQRFATCILLLLPAFAGAESLSARYQRLACAVVQLRAPHGPTATESGTGVFINHSGDILTAAHVVFNIGELKATSNNNVQPSLTYRSDITMIREGVEASRIVLPPISDDDRIRAKSDLAILHTGTKTDCALTMSGVDNAHVGNHVIVIGYPLFTAAKTLLTGTISSREPHPHIPIGAVNGSPVYSNYEEIRFQMPLSTAFSGAPLIADDDTVIGVVTESTLIWSGELNELMSIYENRPEGFKVLKDDKFDGGKVDTQRLLALLAYLVQNSLSTGIGVAVPTAQAKVPADTTA